MSRDNQGTSTSRSSSARHRAAHRRAAPSSSPGTSRAQAPLNAASAAHRAARARAGEVDRLRQAAAGRTVRGHAGSSDRPKRAVVAVSVLVGIALAVLLLVVAGNAVVRALLHDDRVPADAVLGGDTAQATPDDVVALASDGATIEVDDMVYSLVASDEGYVLARQYAGSSDEPSALFEITGEPVGFAIHRGTFYVVSQAGGSFYIQAYVPADGSVPTDYREGEGTIVGMEIRNGALVLVDDAGQEQSFDLPQA